MIYGIRDRKSGQLLTFIRQSFQPEIPTFTVFYVDRPHYSTWTTPSLSLAQKIVAGKSDFVMPKADVDLEVVKLVIVKNRLIAQPLN